MSQLGITIGDQSANDLSTSQFDISMGEAKNGLPPKTGKKKKKKKGEKVKKKRILLELTEEVPSNQPTTARTAIPSSQPSPLDPPLPPIASQNLNVVIPQQEDAISLNNKFDVPADQVHSEQVEASPR